jgi:aldose 1-epimerase
MLTISCGDAICTVHPELGGSLGSWMVAGQPMLRSASASAIADGNLLGMATFPLVPYSNRIGDGTFLWDGQTIQLAKNFAPEPHAIHGVGWQRAWLVADHGADTVTLTLSHLGDESWPWPFEAEQRIIVSARQLDLILAVRNLANHAAPLAFGHHPYFDQANATLHFAADTVWLSGDDGLPTTPIAPSYRFDFNDGALVEGRDIDRCYAGISGAAQVTWADRPLALEIASSPQLNAAVVYIPKDGDAFCFEPVPHVNNALNLPSAVPAMPVITAGDSFQTKITLRAFPHQNRASQA